MLGTVPLLDVNLSLQSSNFSMGPPNSSVTSQRNRSTGVFRGKPPKRLSGMGERGHLGPNGLEWFKHKKNTRTVFCENEKHAQCTCDMCFCFF